jgi:hypothetical protein
METQELMKKKRGRKRRKMYGSARKKEGRRQGFSAERCLKVQRGLGLRNRRSGGEHPQQEKEKTKGGEEEEEGVVVVEEEEEEE